MLGPQRDSARRLRESTPAAEGPRARRGWNIAIAALLLGHLCFVFLNFQRVGLSYDEEWHIRHGENVIRWYESGFSDRSFAKHFTLRNYGSLFEISGILLSRASGLAIIPARHLLTGLFAWLALAGIMRIAWRMAGCRAAFFAGLVLVLFSRFVGHGFNNPKDIPLAALYVWAVNALIAWHRRGGRLRLLSFGTLSGLAMSVRLPALILFAGLGAALGMRWIQRRKDDPAERLSVQARRLAGCGLCSYIVAFPFWPWFHLSPILNPLRVLRDHRGAAGHFDVFFLGESVRNDQLPWHYTLSFALNILPEAWLLGVIIFGVVGIYHRIQRRAVIDSAWSLLALQAILPFALAIVLRPMLFDGVRHFLFALVLFAVPAGAGLALLSRVPGPRPRFLAFAAILAACAPSVWDQIALHPYQVTGFNRLVAGGLPRASQSFETDYWGSSLREGSEWLAENHGGDGKRPTVASSGHSSQVRSYLPRDRFKYIGSVDHELERKRYADPPDYYIATTRWNRHLCYPGPVIHRITRQGVTLLVIVEVDHGRSRSMR